ncbi:MAG: OmpH family outer membrane protein [Rikenellaceae bacterium]
MKRLLILFAAIFASLSSLEAQNYMVVNSEQVFKSITAYNSALTEIETLSQRYQTGVDAKFTAVEQMYNTYVAQRNSMTAAQRTARESEILKAEEEANEYQESIFSTEGELMKRRIELISPIQSRVFETIESYAITNGFDLVIDLSSNATVLYNSERVDRTTDIINLLK